jgi:NADH dehydrogenase
VLARGQRAPVSPASGVQFQQGSVLEPATLPEACRGCDAIVHLVGIISEIGGQTFERIHVEGTRNLLQAAAAAGVKTWVHMSALGSRPDAPSRYHRTKFLAEELVRAQAPTWTIFRPSLVYGPGDGFTTLFDRMSRWSPVLPLIGGGHSRVQPIAVDEVAHCFGSALSTPAALRATFDLCGPQPLTFREVIASIVRHAGRRRWLVPIPWWIARSQARLLECVFPWVFRQAPPLNREQLKMLAEDNVGDFYPAAKAFTFTPRPFLAPIPPPSNPP